jgi:hypothetical protein
LIEPDFLPVSVAEPPEIRAFWDGWLAWSRQQGIDKGDLADGVGQGADAGVAGRGPPCQGGGQAG